MEKIKYLTKSEKYDEIQGVGYKAGPGLTEDGLLHIIATREIVDRDKDIVYIDGIQTDNFARNPVFLKAHQSWVEPIGKITKFTKTTDAGGVKQLEIWVEFAPTEAGDLYKTLFAGGFLNAVSIGFGVREYSVNNQRRGLDIQVSELYEVSAAAVPINQDALVMRAFNDKMDQVDELIGKLEELSKSLRVGDAGGVDETENLIKSMRETTKKIKSGEKHNG